MRKKRQFTIVAVLVIAAIGSIIWASTNWAKEPNLSIKQLATSNGRYTNEQVKVTGWVNVENKPIWDDKNQTLHFWLSTTKGNDSVAVVFPGPKPDNFEKSAKALVTGQVEKDGSLLANSVETYCPSDYKTKNNNNLKIK